MPYVCYFQIMELYRDIALRSQILSSTRGYWPGWVNAVGYLVSVAMLILCVIMGFCHALYISEGRHMKEVCIGLLLWNNLLK